MTFIITLPQEEQDPELKDATLKNKKSERDTLERAALEYACYLNNLQMSRARTQSTDEFSTGSELKRAAIQYSEKPKNPPLAKIPIQNPESFCFFINLLCKHDYPIKQIFKDPEIDIIERLRVGSLKDDLFKFISQIILPQAQAEKPKFQTIANEDELKTTVRAWLTDQKINLDKIYPGVGIQIEEKIKESIGTPPQSQAAVVAATPPTSPSAINGQWIATNDDNVSDSKSTTFKTSNTTQADSDRSSLSDQSAAASATSPTSPPKTPIQSTAASARTGRMSATSSSAASASLPSSPSYFSRSPSQSSLRSTLKADSSAPSTAKKTLQTALNETLLTIKAAKNAITKSHHNLFDLFITTLGQSVEKPASILFKLLADYAEMILHQDMKDAQAKKTPDKGLRLSTVLEQIRTAIIQTVSLPDEVRKQEFHSTKTLLTSLQIHAKPFLTQDVDYASINSVLQKATGAVISTSDLQALAEAIDQLKENKALPLWLRNNYEDLLPRLHTCIALELGAQRSQAKPVSKRLDFSSLRTPTRRSASTSTPESPASTGSAEAASRPYAEEEPTDALLDQFIRDITYEIGQYRKFGKPGTQALSAFLTNINTHKSYQEVLAALTKLDIQQFATNLTSTTFFSRRPDPFALQSFCTAIKERAYFLFSASAAQVYEIESQGIIQAIRAVTKTFSEETYKDLKERIQKINCQIPENGNPFAHYQAMTKVISLLNELESAYSDLFLPEGTLKRIGEQWQKLVKKLSRYPDNMWFAFTNFTDALRTYYLDDNQSEAPDFPSSIISLDEKLQLDALQQTRLNKLLSFLEAFVLQHTQNQKTFKILELKQQNEFEYLMDKDRPNGNSFHRPKENTHLTVIYQADGQDYQLTVKNFGYPQEESFDLKTAPEQTDRLQAIL